MNFRLGKHPRDLIAHPGIEINFGSEKLDFVAVFDRLDMDMLRNIETQVDSWLDAVCAILKVPRFTDTEGTVTKLGESLGELKAVREI
jgi:hypothetical protein